MSEAIRVAGRLARPPWPNPPVGALVVRDGRVIGRGAHHGAGTEHAEVVALSEAGRNARGATLYCTLEPCNHQGRMPPCAPLVATSGISRLVVGILDPNPRVCGGGIEAVRAAGVEVCSGVLGLQALELIWPFVATNAFERPFVLLKTATSLDGRWAPRPVAARGPVYLTGVAARREAHRLRRWCDVVLVGEGTMRTDRPRLDGRLAPGDPPSPLAEPMPAYADSDLSLDEDWPRRPHWVFASGTRSSVERRRVVESRGGEVVECAEWRGHVAAESIVAEFQRRGGHCLLVEGGPRLAAAFIASGLVDRWVSYTAPVVLGGGVGWPDFGRPGWNESSDAVRHRPAIPAPFHLTRVAARESDVETVLDRLCFSDELARLGAAALDFS